MLHALIPYRTTLQVVLIILSLALIASILMQARGAGLGSVFGGTGTVFKTRRGIERLLFGFTTGFAIAFALLCFVVFAIPAS